MADKNSILDWVRMSNGNTMTGVVDFSTDRFIHFFNFDILEDDPDLVLAAILWRMKYSHMRFSVFCSTMFPKLPIPQVNLVNLKGVEEVSSIKYTQGKPSKTRVDLG